MLNSCLKWRDIRMGISSKSLRLFVVFLLSVAVLQVHGQESTTPDSDLLLTTDATTELPTTRDDLLMTTEEVTGPAVTEEVCLGIEDCAGVCNGDAEEDCAGTCSGSAEEDCAGVCAGSAFINGCNECVGGTTKRANDFGADQCGNCVSDPNYEETWDCYGTCNGTAIIDACNECVGGDTGDAEDVNDDRLDCRNICDGGWEADNCTYCEPPSNVVYDYGSKYKDCTEQCVTPGNTRAYENDCSECVGGGSGNAVDYGINVCGQCESDPSANVSSCEGCDGVANSGKVNDACGVCDGDGSDCVGVSRVTPNLIPDNAVVLAVAGAGFTDGSTLKCIFVDDSDSSEYEGAMGSWTSTQAMTCAADLAAGSYTVKVSRDGSTTNDVTGSLEVYADITISSISPVNFTTNSTSAGDMETIVATASSGSAFTAIRALNTDDYDVLPVLLAEDDDGVVMEYEGTFTSNSEITFDFELPANSARLKLMPTVNGESSLALATDPTYGFVLYKEPTAESAKFTDTGAGLTVSFDIGVDYEAFSSCDDIFSNAEDLGTGARCKWRTPQELYIVIGRGDGLIEIGDTLDFIDDAVYAFRQDYGMAASGSVVIDGPDNALQPTAKLSGSLYLPSCGDVELSGRRSSGGGGRSIKYEWILSSTSGSSGGVQGILDDLNSANNGSGSALLEFDGAELDADTDYNFELVVENFLSGNDTLAFTVVRASNAVPQVNVLPVGIDPSNVKVADSFSITAEVTFYSACVPAGETVFEWTCNDTSVPVNLKTQYSRTLYVPENTLPGGEAVMFTVKVYKSSDSSAYVEQSVTLETVQSDLVAIISGASEYSIGRDSGNVTIDGSLTYDPDEEARPWVYSYRCIQTTDNSACWSYNPDRIGQQIFDDADITDAVLTFDALGFQADKTYEITLVARKLQRTSTATVVISAVAGNPPKISFNEVQDGGTVKSTDVIFLTAKIYEATASDTFTWSTVGTEDGYGFIDLADSSNLLSGSPQVLDSSSSGYIIATIGIQGGVAERGTSYAIQLSATNSADQTGTAKAYITVRSGPTSCDFTVEDYTTLDEAGSLVEYCVADEDSLPLKYQLYTEDADGSYKSISDALSEPSTKFVGIASSSGSTRKYIIEVCNRFKICSSYEDTVTVTAKSSFTTSEKSTYKETQVDEYRYKRNYLRSLRNLGVLAEIEASSRRRRDVSRVRRVAAETSTETAAEQVELIGLILDESVLTTSSAQVVIDNTDPLVVTDLSITDQDDLLDYFLEMIAVFQDADVSVPDASSDIILEKVGQIADGLDPAFYSSVLDKCREVQERLLGSLTAELVLGGGVTEVSDSDLTLGIQKTLLSGSFSSKTSGTTIGIDFGSEVSNMFGAAWTCSSGSDCSGVTLKISHYNTGVDVYSTSDADRNQIAADIIELILADPDSDAELSVSGLSTPIELTFPLTVGLSDVSYTCVAWDTGSSSWSSSGVTTGSVSGGNVVCQTTHLTVFTVLGTPVTTTRPVTTVTNAMTTDDGSGGGGGGSGVDGTLLGIIIGSVIGGILLIIIIIVIVFCLCKAKKNKKVGPEDEERIHRTPRSETPTENRHVRSRKTHHEHHEHHELERRPLHRESSEENY